MAPILKGRSAASDDHGDKGAIIAEYRHICHSLGAHARFSELQ